MDYAGTPSFMVPEVCAGEVHDGRLADCFVLGATMFCVRIGYPPFIGKAVTKNQRPMDMYHQIKNNPLSFHVPLSRDLQELLSGLIEKDPMRRVPLSDAMRHAWLQNTYFKQRHWGEFPTTKG
jgi:serine/threonine protein kinase